MLKKVIDINKEVAVLDIGTNTICASIAKKDKKSNQNSITSLENETRILGVGYQLAKGIKKGAITNLEEFEESILNAISTAEKEAQKSIKSIFVAIPSWAIKSQIANSSINIGQTPVDDIHINSLMDFNKGDYIQNDTEILHIFPISYAIDDVHGIQDPIGMIGNKLSATFNILTTKSLFLKNIKNCLNRNNISINGFISSSYASTLSIAVEDELSSGVTVIDIGGSVTSISCIKSGILVYSSYIPIGGQSITNDISMVLRTNKSNAERLKILYGVYSGELNHQEEQIFVSRVDEYGEEHIQNISKSMLNKIISARLEELLDLAQKHIYDKISDKSLCQRILITGGGSRLSGVLEFIKAKRYFNDSFVRLGRPIGAIGSHDFVKTQSFSAAAGIISYCLNESKRSSIMNMTNEKSLSQRILTWIKRGI